MNVPGHGKFQKIGPDGKEIYVLADGVLKSGKLGDKIKLKGVATSPVMALNAAKERDLTAVESKYVLSSLSDLFLFS